MNNNFKNYCEKEDVDMEIDESNIKLPLSIKPNFLSKKNFIESESSEEEIS